MIMYVHWIGFLIFSNLETKSVNVYMAIFEGWISNNIKKNQFK